MRMDVRRYASSRRTSIECERRREVPVRLDLRFEIGDLLLCSGNGIGAGNEASRWRLLTGNRDERSRELRGVAGLLSVLGFPIFEQRSSALVVVRDGRLGVVRGLLREEFRTKESWIDDRSY